MAESNGSLEIKRLPRHAPQAARILAEETLFEELEAVAQLRSDEDFGRQSAKRAISACYSFLLVRGLSGQALKPLQNLLAALDDVANGTLPELFDPKLKPGRAPVRRWTRSAAGKEIKLYAAGCMDALMRNGKSKKSSAEKVARAIEKWPLVSTGVIKPGTVTNWRDDLLQRPTSDVERDQFQRLSSSLSEGPRAEHYLEQVLGHGPPLSGGIVKKT